MFKLIGKTYTMNGQLVRNIQLCVLKPCFGSLILNRFIHKLLVIPFDLDLIYGYISCTVFRFIIIREYFKFRSVGIFSIRKGRDEGEVVCSLPWTLVVFSRAWRNAHSPRCVPLTHSFFHSFDQGPTSSPPQTPQCFSFYSFSCQSAGQRQAQQR